MKPVTVLLEFVRMVNKKHSLYDIPPMQGGSREVNQVYTCLAKLYKIVRFGNMAFFSGNMKLAYKCLKDALSIFRSADDQKAVGICANNLGNTLLTIRNQALSTRKCFTIDGECVQKLALQSYDEAISSSTEECNRCFQMSENDELRARLLEQMANRYFNRCLFFLFSANDACTPSSFGERGYQDLKKTSELDAMVREIWVTKRQIHRNSVRYFERLLRRANGLTALVRKGIIDSESWNIVELLAEANSLLYVVWNVPNSPLFDSLTRIGRLQQLEFSTIRFEMCRRKVQEATKVATRMLAEDEYIDADTFSAAASAFMSWFRQVPPPEYLGASELAIRRDFRRMLKCCKSTCPDAAVGKNMVFFQDLARHNEYDFVLESFCRKIYSSCHCNDSLIWTSQRASDQDVMLTLQQKSDREQPDWSQQWERIREPNKAIRRAIQIVLETKELSLNDTWIIMMTDRSRWDSVQCPLSESHHYLLSEVGELNRDRCTTIHFAVISIEANENMAVICSELCRVSKESMYIEVSDVNEELTEALTDVAWLVIGGGKRQCSIPQGITMEKF